jgi:hypothetical protein
MEEDDMVKSMAIASYGERRTDDKEVPRASRRLALAAPKSSRACTRVMDKISLTSRLN